MNNGLALISIGLSDESDISLRAVDEAQKCDVLYLETYTTKLNINVARLESIIGKPIGQLSRSNLEEHSGMLLEESQHLKVGVLIGGDCLSATTHIALLIEAKKKSIPISIIHGSSIFTAIAETGLSLYKFGRTVTLPLPSKGSTETTLNGIQENIDHGLHTLILLDLDVEAERYLSVNEAIEILLNSDRKETFNAGTLTVGASNLGSEEPIIRADRASELSKMDFGAPPQVLVVPGILHFMEEEALKVLGKCPESVLRGRRVLGDMDRLINRYSESCRKVLDEFTFTTTPELSMERAKNLIDHAERYLDDALYYAKDRKATALASVSYCEGILDALKLLGVINFEW